MLTSNVILGYQGLLFRDFLRFFFSFFFFFSIRPTDQIAGNAFKAKRKKKRMALLSITKYIFKVQYATFSKLIGWLSAVRFSVLERFRITSEQIETVSKLWNNSYGWHESNISVDTTNITWQVELENLTTWCKLPSDQPAICRKLLSNGFFPSRPLSDHKH